MMNSPNNSTTPRRTGFTLLELVTTLVLIGVLMAIVVPLLAWTGAIRVSTDHRELAIQESANLLEQLTTRKWESITQTSADELELSPQAKSSLPGATLQIEVAPAEIDLPAKRVTVALRWHNREGHTVPPARLTTLVFRQETVE
jgi:prepilin-type N-terminal cleavage/methylation domain-containing protein